MTNKDPFQNILTDFRLSAKTFSAFSSMKGYNLCSVPSLEDAVTRYLGQDFVEVILNLLTLSDASIDSL